MHGPVVDSPELDGEVLTWCSPQGGGRGAPAGPGCQPAALVPSKPEHERSNHLLFSELDNTEIVEPIAAFGGARPPDRREPSRPPVHEAHPMTPTLTLNNGVELPAIGFGVFQTPPDETAVAVESALRAGYRHVDTAAAYGNERGVGDAIRRSDVDRDDVFIETKVWITDYGYDETLHAFDKSAGKLGVDRIDLLILHQALPSEFDRTIDAYRALEALLADGKVRAIGVSNFMVEHLDQLLADTSIIPAVNQIEVHPYFQQRAVQTADTSHGILTQAWSPIGGITFYRDGRNSSTLDDPAIADIASAHGKSPAQVMLHWHLQQGRSAIPKSTNPTRIAENFDVFDFQLGDDELAAIDALDTGIRGGPEPDAITLEAFGRPIPDA
jgi:2,5-diketo-D-gluconate reductase A